MAVSCSQATAPMAFLPSALAELTAVCRTPIIYRGSCGLFCKAYRRTRCWTHESERVQAADENILNSTRSTDFITSKNEASHFFRNATLELAKDCEFARRLVNSGRLSLPSTYSGLPLEHTQCRLL